VSDEDTIPKLEDKLKKAKADSKALDQVCHFVKTTLYRDVWVNDEPTEYQKWRSS
jgi:hypothetical protein